MASYGDCGENKIYFFRNRSKESSRTSMKTVHEGRKDSLNGKSGVLLRGHSRDLTSVTKEKSEKLQTV